MSVDRRAFNRTVLGLLLAPAGARAQSPAASPHRTLYLSEGAARQEQLLAGACREGLVVIYTSLNTQDSTPLVTAFEKKYGVKTQLWRANSERLVQRGISEARAGRFACDVLETAGLEMEALSREQVLDQFHSPPFRGPAAGRVSEARAVDGDRFNFFTIGYNTRLVPPEEVPNSYDDLLRPRFEGRIGLEAGDVDWFGAMVRHMGKEKGLAFFRKLAATKPKIRIGHTLIGQLVASGEIPLAANLYNHNVERVAVQGAPIRWKALTPTFGRPNAIGIARRAPHPHAGLLFADVVLSREGQMILKSRYRVPSSRAVDSTLNDFSFEMIDAAITLDENQKWSKLWSDLFLRGQRVPRDAG